MREVQTRTSKSVISPIGTYPGHSGLTEWEYNLRKGRLISVPEVSADTDDCSFNTDYSFKWIQADGCSWGFQCDRYGQYNFHVCAINVLTKSYLASVCLAVQQLCCPCADCTGCIWQLDPVGCQRNGNSQEEGWEENQKHTEQGKNERTGVWEGMVQAKGQLGKTKQKGHNYTT